MREDWIEDVLGNIFETVTGNTPSKKEKDNYGSEIPFIKPPQINNNFLNTSVEFLSPKGKLKARILPISSVLVTCIGNLGRIGINKTEVAFNQQINAVKPISGIESKFTFYQAQTVNFRNQLEQLSTSTTVALVNKSNFNSVKFKIAPLVEQKAIVKKIEELFSSLDSGIADLKKAQDQLTIYRQSVLKKAFEGEQILNAKKDKLKNITSKIGSGSTPKGGQANYKTSGIPLVRSLNIHFDYIKYYGLAFIDKNQAEKLKNVIIQEGDVLLNITGASIGRVNIAPKEFDNGRVNQHVSIIRPKDNIFITKFLKLYLQSSKIQNWIANVNVGATRQGLTKAALENLKIPTPTLKLQYQIVQEIESRLSVCDKVEESIKESLGKAQALRQSILKKAFEGKLLSVGEIARCKADKDYEPASVLLKRIEKEKNK